MRQIPIRVPQVVEAPEEEKGFKGGQATKISESYVFGAEALLVMKQMFPFSDNREKFKLSMDVEHPHAYAAFLRKHADNAIMRGFANGQVVLDVGGHAIRSANSRRYMTINGRKTSVCWDHLESQHSMLPIVETSECQDEVRHMSWKQKLHAGGKMPNYGAPFYNACNQIATVNGLCQCAMPDGTQYRTQTLKSIDSAYYPGVADGMFREIQASGRVAYFAFHDYAKAVRRGVMEFDTFDGEAHVKCELRGDGYWVQSAVRGNPHVYEHRIIDTEDTWFLSGQHFNVCCQVVKRMPASEFHDYIVVEAIPLPRPVTGKRAHGSWFMSGTSVLHEKPISTKLRKMKEWLVSLLRDASDVSDYSVEDAADELLDIKFWTKVQGKACFLEYRDIDVELLNTAYLELVGKTDVSASDRAVKALLIKVGGVKQTYELDQIHKTVDLATWLVAHHSLNRYVHWYEEKTIKDVRLARKGTMPVAESDTWSLRLWKTFGNTLSEVMRSILASFAVVVPIIYVVYSLMVSGVKAQVQYTIDNRNDHLLLQMLFGYVGFVVLYVLSKKAGSVVMKGVQRRLWLPSSCVVDPARLELKKPRLDPKWKFKDRDWDISGLNGLQAYHMLGCDKEADIGAGQIGPLVVGSTMRTPTVKHSCKRTQMSAAIRTTTNLLYPDPVVFDEWLHEVFHPMCNQFLQAVKNIGIRVDLDEWKQKYPGSYQALVDETLNNVDFRTTCDLGYEMFPKIELNYTTVDPDLKETELNTVKERAIQAPNMKRRVAANAFVNELERVAHLSIKEFCGRCNWADICAKVEPYNVFGYMFGASDGSGFDMTQTLPFQQVWRDFMKKILDLDFEIDERITREDILAAFDSSLILEVSVGRGAVKYQAEGRASGDGWTTFANTFLMISYWRFVFHKADIVPPFLLVKGDDVLFAVKTSDVKFVQQAISRVMAATNTRAEFGLGQIVKKVDWGSVEDIDFLSNYFVTTSNGLRMTRIPDRVFQTMPWSCKLKPNMRNHEKVARELIHSKGCSLLAWARGLPIFEVYARKLISLGVEGENVEYCRYTDDMRQWEDVDDYDAFCAWMDVKFGLSRSEIRDIEARINAIQHLTEIVVIPELDKFIP